MNTYPPTLITKMLNALREQLKENDHLDTVEKIAIPAPEIPLEYDRVLKDGGGFWDELMEDFCQKISCWLPDVKRLHGYILKVSTKVSRCKGVQMQARNC